MRRPGRTPPERPKDRLNLRRIFNLSVLLPLTAILSFVFGVWGWSMHAAELKLTMSDVLYDAIGGISLAPFTDGKTEWSTNWRLDVSRWLGVFAFLTTVTGALWQLLGRQAREYMARFRRGHIILIGDHKVARSLAEAAARRKAKTTWLAGDEAAADMVPGILVIPRRWHRALARPLAVRHARRAVVALADEVQQIATVRSLRAAAPNLPIAMNVDDPWFADRLDELENISGVRYVSEAALAIRSLHERHPPFLLAEKFGQQRIHAVIFGFGIGGEAVLSDLLLSQLTSHLGPPRVTIVDPRAAEIERSLGQRAPELGRSAEIHLIEPEFAHDVRALPAAALEDAHADCPLTLAYVAVDSDERSMGLAVCLQALARREGWAMGPIYTRLSTFDAFPHLAAIEAEGGPPAGLMSWGDPHEFAEEIGLFGAQADRLPRAFHEAYRRVAPDQAGDVAWEKLSEEARDSNRHLIAHLPAKLASIGVDPLSWQLAALDGPGVGRRPPPMPDFEADPALLERLAALEHARWMMERRLGGWQHGPVRDNFRRLHPGLVPWEELPERERGFNRRMVASMIAAIAEAG